MATIGDPIAQNARNTPPPTSSAGISASSSANSMIEQAKSVLAQLVKTSKMSRSRGSALAEKPEVQVMLDKELFLIQSDRRTKMNALQQLQLVRVLAQFFLERVDDGHRYSYFEAIFLGRSDDAMLHEYRICVLFQLVSFAVQYPVLQIVNHVMGWLCQMKNDEQEKLFSDRLIELIVENFVRLSDEQNRLHDYLLPLESTCSEFCALFVSRAPLFSPLRPSLCELIIRYCTRNMQFLLRHLRDTPWLGNEFAEKVVPRIVEQVLQEEDESKETDSLVTCLCYILLRWHIDVVGNGERRGPTKRIEILELLLSSNSPWTKRKAWLLTSAVGASSKNEALIQKDISRLNVPDAFRPVIELLSASGAKENSQKTFDAVTELQLSY